MVPSSSRLASGGANGVSAPTNAQSSGAVGWTSLFAEGTVTSMEALHSLVGGAQVYADKDQNVRLFRRFWILLVAHKFASLPSLTIAAGAAPAPVGGSLGPSWPPEWYKAIALIASNTPVLIDGYALSDLHSLCTVDSS